MTQLFIAYYRVSTDRQGKSGLGLDAQRSAVANHILGRGELVAEFTEIESGKKNDRPQLIEALAQCRKQKARLVIAKLDRLARNLAFIANLMESSVEFTACDVPEANKTFLQILAVFAEHERDMISKRTKEALIAAKAKGTRLGNPHPHASLTKGRAKVIANLNTHAETVRPLILELYHQGLSQRAIARELNRRHLPTARGKQWQAVQIGNLLFSLTTTQINQTDDTGMI